MQKKLTCLYGIQRGGDRLGDSKLSKALKCEGVCFKKDMTLVYNLFFECFMKKENRPLYRGKFIFFNMSKDFYISTNGITVIQSLPMPERFFHIISLEDGWRKYNVPPCNNDDSIEYCKNECKLHNSTIKEFRLINRTECYYRLIIMIIILRNGQKLKRIKRRIRFTRDLLDTNIRRMITLSF